MTPLNILIRLTTVH